MSSASTLATSSQDGRRRRGQPATVDTAARFEAFVESYHFPFIHGDSIIGQSALGNTAIYDAYGKHVRMGFPFNWISNLDGDPNSS